MWCLVWYMLLGVCGAWCLLWSVWFVVWCLVSVCFVVWYVVFIVCMCVCVCVFFFFRDVVLSGVCYDWLYSVVRCHVVCAVVGQWYRVWSNMLLYTLCSFMCYFII